MQSRRLYVNYEEGLYTADDEQGVFKFSEIRPGDFWLYRGRWRAKAPNGLICNLDGHDVEVDDSGIIPNVSPSILVRGTDDSGNEISWHGFLEHGFWRQVD